MPGWLPLALLLVAYFGIDSVLPVLAERWVKHWAVFSEYPDSGWFLDYLWFFLVCGQWGMLDIWLVFGTARWPLRVIVSLGGAVSLTATVIASDMAIRGEMKMGELRGALSAPLFLVAASGPLWPMWLWRGWRMTHPASPSKPGKAGIRGLLCATAVIAATMAAAREGAAEVVAEQRTAAVVQNAIMGVAAGVLVFLPAFCAVFMCKRAMLGFLLIVLFASAVAAALAVTIAFVATLDGRQPFVIQLAMCAALFLGPTLPLAGSLLVMRWAGWTLCRQPHEITTQAGGC